MFDLLVKQKILKIDSPSIIIVDEISISRFNLEVEFDVEMNLS